MEERNYKLKIFQKFETEDAKEYLENLFKELEDVSDLKFPAPTTERRNIEDNGVCRWKGGTLKMESNETTHAKFNEVFGGESVFRVQLLRVA